MNPIISIIIPVYNVEKYLKRCLDSVVNQSYKNLEIIIINDASPDKSQEIIDEYKNKDKRIISLINRENINPGLTRNVGIEKSTGEYITFIDSDDWIEKTMYEEMVEVAIKNNADIVECNLSVKDINNKNSALIKNLISFFIKSGTATNKYIWHLSKNELGVMATNKIYKNKLIKNNNIKFNDNRIIFSEDLYFNLEVMRYANSIITVNKPFYNYFMRLDSLSHNNNFVNINILVIFINKYVHDNSNSDTFSNDFSAFSIIMLPFMKRAVLLPMLGSKNPLKLGSSILREIRANTMLLKILKNCGVNKRTAIKDKIFCWCILLKLDYIFLYLYILKNKYFK